MTGIGPAYPAWKAGVLPLNYICIVRFLKGYQEPGMTACRIREVSDRIPATGLEPILAHIGVPLFQLSYAGDQGHMTRYANKEVEMKDRFNGRAIPNVSQVHF